MWVFYSLFYNWLLQVLCLCPSTMVSKEDTCCDIPFTTTHHIWASRFSVCLYIGLFLPREQNMDIGSEYNIIIAFEGAVRDFLQSPRCAANHLQHVRSSGPDVILCKSRATHRAHIMCNSCYMPHGTNRQLSITFGRVKIAFTLALFDWLSH